MDKIVVHWRIENNQVKYYANDVYEGTGNVGLNQILRLIKRNPKAEVIIHMQEIPALESRDLTDHLPFKDRFPDLLRALGRRSIEYDFL